MNRLWLRTLLAITLLATAVPLLGLVRIDIDRQRLTSRYRVGEDYYLPPPAIIRALTFGYNEFFADLLWVRTIIYFADHMHSDRSLTHLGKHLRNVLALDKHFYAVYRYGSAMLMTAGNNIATKDAIAILKQGHRYFPTDWKMAFNIGSYYMWELRTKKPEERAAWKREGADWIRRAALLGADMPWLPSLAANIFTEHGQRDLAIRHLEEIYLTTQDPKTKEQITAKLTRLREASSQTQLERFAAMFKQRREQSPLTFLDDDLFAVIDLTPPKPFDLEAI